MMVFHYLGADSTIRATFDEALVVQEAQGLGEDAAGLWEAVKEAARREASRFQRKAHIDPTPS